jgi:hypothetical protein
VFKTYTGYQSGETLHPLTSPAAGRASSAGGWQPSVLYLLGLTIAEILAVGWLTTHLR